LALRWSRERWPCDSLSPGTCADETKDERKLVDLEEKDLTRSRSRRPAASECAGKEWREWKLTEPVSAPADTFAVDSASSAAD